MRKAQVHSVPNHIPVGGYLRDFIGHDAMPEQDPHILVTSVPPPPLLLFVAFAFTVARSFRMSAYSTISHNPILVDPAEDNGYRCIAVSSHIVSILRSGKARHRNESEIVVPSNTAKMANQKDDVHSFCC